MFNGYRKLSEGTAAMRRIYFHLVDATDGITAETGEAAGQPQVSKNGGAFANTTATLVAIGNGRYYVELTAAELDTLGTVQLRYKSAATAEAVASAQVIASDLAVALATQTSVDAVDDLVDTEVGLIYTRLGAPAGASIAADILTRATPASVQTSVAAELDAASVELTAVPTTTGSVRQFIQFFHSYFRNRKTQTATLETLYKEDAATTLGTAILSDSGSLVTKGEMN